MYHLISGIIVSDFRPCDSHECLNNATCVVDVVAQDYSCKCNEDFYGRKCGGT